MFSRFFTRLLDIQQNNGESNSFVPVCIVKMMKADVSVCGLAVLLQLFKTLSWVNVEAMDCLATMKHHVVKVPCNGKFNIKYAKRRLKSLRPLKVKGMKRRRVRVPQQNVSELEIPLTREEVLARKQEFYSSTSGVFRSFYIGLVVASRELKKHFLFVILGGLYYAYILLKNYRQAQEVQVVVSVLNPSPRVGQTLTCRVRFKKKGSGTIPYSSKLFQDLSEKVEISVTSNKLKRAVATLLEVNAINSHILGKFSLRNSGIHKIDVKLNKFSLQQDETFYFDVYPGLPNHKCMDFGTHNPQVLCLTAGYQQCFKIAAEDEHGNESRLQDINLEKLSFESFHVNPINLDCEFSHQEIAIKEIRIHEACMKIKLEEPGVYPSCLKYDNEEVHGNFGTKKLLVCISPDEEKDLQRKYDSLNRLIPGTFIFTCECRASFGSNDPDNFQEFYAGISSSYLVLAWCNWALYLSPNESYPINGKTKIFYYESETMNSEIETITLLVRDGLRPSVYVKLPPSSARLLLATFAHNQGFVLPKLGNSFQAKKAALKKRLSSYLSEFWWSGQKTLIVENWNLARSTMKVIPKTPDDWLLPFNIKYDGYTPKSPSVQEWLNRLCEEFFLKNGEYEMFHKLNGSTLLHPTPSSLSRLSLDVYRLAGQILGKSIVEALLRNVCTRLSTIRFSRSLLASILGFPIRYNFLETDEPTYFRRIKQILESDSISESGYTFTTLPSSPSDTDTFNLIPNGSKTSVTNENREHYLNLLACHKLIHSVEPEITAFRAGFYDVIDKDKLCDFDENDLQMLISGGCEFSIKELQKYHRVVREVENGFDTRFKRPLMHTKKVLNWFWTVVQNMSEKEHSNLVFFTTGSFSLPSCGLADLNPPFTINLTGTLNQPPKGHPISNEIVLGDHTTFDSFEGSLLYAIKPESERMEEQPIPPLLAYLEEIGEGQVEQEEIGSLLRHENESTQQSPSDEHGSPRMAEYFSQEDFLGNWIQGHYHSLMHSWGLE